MRDLARGISNPLPELLVACVTSICMLPAAKIVEIHDTPQSLELLSEALTQEGLDDPSLYLEVGLDLIYLVYYPISSWSIWSC